MAELQTTTANLSKSKGTIPTRGLDFIITGVIALVFFLAPIFFTGLVAQGLGFEKMMVFYFLVLLGIVAWVTKGVIMGELNLKRTPLDIPIVATIIIFAVSTILSVSSKDSLIGAYGNSAKSFIAIIVFALFYYLVINNLDSKKIKTVFFSFIASISLLVIYSLLQLGGFFAIPLKLTESRSFNPLGSLSGLTMFIVSILPLLVVATTQVRDIFPNMNKIFASVLKVVIGLVSVGALVVLAILNGFTFWPAAVVGMVIVLMFYLAKIIKISSNNLIIPLAVFLALIILLVLGNFNIVNLNLPAEVSLSRGASWDIAKSSLRDNPIFGSGPSTFYYSFAKYKDMSFNASPLWNVRFDSASGAIFEILATVGVLGFVSLIVLGLISISLSFLTILKTNNKEVNSILLGLFASFITTIILGLLYSQNNSLILLNTIVAIFAVTAALVMYPEKFKELKLSFRSSAKYALALAAIFLCVSAGVVVLFTMGLKMYMADIYARKALLVPGQTEKITLLNKAVALAPYQDVYYLNLANNYMAIANQAAIGGGDQTKVGQNLSQAIESGKKAVDIAGNKASNNESLALIYENASFYTRGALEWAESFYNKVVELDPTNPTPSLRIALVNMARANAETDPEEKKFYIGEAIKKYDESIEKKGDLAAAYYGKAIAHEKLGDTDDAIEQLKRANLVSRNNLDYRFELGRMYFNRGVTTPNISQSASQEIAEADIKPEFEPVDDELEGEEVVEERAEEISVTPTPPAPGAVITRNGDLNAAEQLFLSILLANANHANARYSLAVLYQKIGETDNARTMVNSLLEILQDANTRAAVEQQFASIL